jgi:hypothetical protein
MGNFLLRWLERLGRKRVINDRFDNEPYLERYYLFLRDRQGFPFNIFLHHFLKSDPDDVHDHPWGYMTWVIKGGYYEWEPTFDAQGNMTGELSHWRGVGHIRFRSATSYHRIELAPETDCWTIFIPGTQRREWGFLVNNVWVQYEKYLAARAKRLGIPKALGESLEKSSREISL